jgi:hypothetical protein
MVGAAIRAYGEQIPKRARKSGGFTAINLDPPAPAAIQRAAEREMASAAMASAANTRMQIPPPPQFQRSQARGSLHGTNDSKEYGGIKYERKSSGPFQGRFVSQGSITIDGDDYVEYRVLTKPSFF